MTAEIMAAYFSKTLLIRPWFAWDAKFTSGFSSTRELYVEAEGYSGFFLNVFAASAISIQSRW
jgi:hypothetical protein